MRTLPSIPPAERLWQVLESSYELVQLVHVQGRLLYDKGWQEPSDANNPGQSWIECWEGQSKGAAASALAEAQRGQSARFEGFSRAFDGVPKWWAVTVTPIAHHDERVTRLLVSARDITEHKQSHEELQRAYRELDKVRSELAHVARIETFDILGAGIAHELKQPLAAVRSNAKYAAQALTVAAGRDEIRASLADIVRDTDRACQVIDRFREYMRRGLPVLEPCDVDAVVLHVVSLLRPDAAKRRIDLDAHVDHAPIVSADCILLQQLLVNLVSNALDAVDDPAAVGRAVIIRTARGESGAIVRVEDCGAVMSDDSFSRIVEPFYSSKAEGSGVGLSICRHILALHGSELHIERNPDGGWAVSFELATAHGKDRVL